MQRELSWLDRDTLGSVNVRFDWIWCDAVGSPLVARSNARTVARSTCPSAGRVNFRLSEFVRWQLDVRDRIQDFRCRIDSDGKAVIESW